MKNKLQLSDELLFVKGRYKTFKNWPFDENSKCSTLMMAKAGFFYGGEDDVAQCYFCFKTLDNWEKDDDPMIEHQNHNSNCKFVTLKKTEGDMTVRDFIDLIEFRWTNIWKESNKETLEKYKIKQEKFKISSF